MQSAPRVAVGVVPADRFGAEGTRSKIIRGGQDPVSGKAIDMVVAVRKGGTDFMHARGDLTDRQRDAADRFLMTYELAHSDGMKAIDYSKINVDCMGQSDVFGGERIVRAIKELARIEQAIGGERYAILVSIVVERGTISSIAKAMIAAAGGGSYSKKRAKVSKRLIEALDGLDGLWNVAVGAGKKMRSSGGERGEVMVDFKPVVVEATNAQGLEFVQGIAKLKESQAKRKAGLE